MAEVRLDSEILLALVMVQNPVDVLGGQTVSWWDSLDSSGLILLLEVEKSLSSYVIGDVVQEER
jgi:hypothetical protein